MMRGDAVIADGLWSDDQLTATRVSAETFIYTNGDRYSRLDVGGRRSGAGPMEWRDHKDWKSYDGQWREDKMEGKGVMEYRDGCRYDGNWRRDERDGAGVLRCPDGRRFEGVWADGEWVDGKLFSADGNAVTDGLWRAGAFVVRRIGGGAYEYPDGGRYTGPIERGNRLGRGRMEWSDHKQWKSYDGQWRADQKHGTGVMEYRDGSRYDGGWWCDSRAALGTMTWPPDSQVVALTGQWEDDRPIYGRRGRMVVHFTAPHLQTAALLVRFGLNPAAPFQP
jgi:hypothetical protein